jgi:hypothetical protein
VRTRWGALIAGAVLLTACSDGGGEPLYPLRPGPTGPAHQVATGIGTAGDGTLDLLSGATTVTVRDADLGPDRVRVSTPEGSEVAPTLAVDGGTVGVHLTRTGAAGPAAVTVLLDRRVRWTVRLSAGATSQLLDLRGGRLAGVDLLGGATRIELRLPAPRGAVPVRMAGGATELAVHLPPGAAASVRAGGGAGTAVLDGVRTTGIAGGTVLAGTTAPDRYDIDATAGVSSLLLDRQ